MIIPANNRQLKMMRLFGVPVTRGVSADTARKLISEILADPANRERWDKYVYLTHDVSSESAYLKPFDPATLEGVVVPQGWYAARAEREYHEEIAAKILKNGEPYDVPGPPVAFKDRIFLFTGRFNFGARALCEQAVLDRGGLIPESDQVSHVIDYLVVGAKGSERWKRSTYGSKIEAAVAERHIHGKPAIITEATSSICSGAWCRTGWTSAGSTAIPDTPGFEVTATSATRRAARCGLGENSPR